MKQIFEWEMEDFLERHPNGLYFLSLDLRIPSEKIHLKDGAIKTHIGGVTIRKHEKRLLLISTDFTQLNYVFKKDFLMQGAEGTAFYWQMPLPHIECWLFSAEKHTRMEHGVSKKYAEKYAEFIFEKFGINFENKLFQKMIELDYNEDQIPQKTISTSIKIINKNEGL